MGLYINSSLMSLQTQRRLTETTSRLKRSFERLSSGLRINSARDDAAGLMISTRMNSALLSGRAAIKNTNDGISLAQTLEGSLQEVTQRLQRMRELSVQALSETLSVQDRASLEQELSQLKGSIDELSEQSSFNGIKLLQGDLLDVRLQVGQARGEERSLTIGKVSSSELGRQAQQISLRGVNTQVAIGDQFSDQKVLIAAAQPSTLLSPAVVGIVDPNFPGTPDVVVSEAVPPQLISPAIPRITNRIPGDDNTADRFEIVQAGRPAIYSPAIPAVIIPGEAPRYLVEPQEAVYSDVIPELYEYQYKGELTINGVKVRATGLYDDPLSTAQRAGSAIAKAKAINAVADQTGVEAIVGPTILGSPSEVDPGLATNIEYVPGLNITPIKTSDYDVSVHLPYFTEDTDVFLAIDNSASNGSNIQNFQDQIKVIVNSMQDLSDGHTIRLGVSFYGDGNLDPAERMPDIPLTDLSDQVARDQLISTVQALDLTTVDRAVEEDMHLSIQEALQQAWSGTARQHLMIIGQGDADNDGFDFAQESIDSADQFLNANTNLLDGTNQRFISTIQIKSTLASEKLIFEDLDRNDAISSIFDEHISNDGRFIDYPTSVLVTATGQNPNSIPTTEHNITQIINTADNAPTNELIEHAFVTLSGLNFPLELKSDASLSVTGFGAISATTLSSGDMIINGVDLFSGGDLAILADDSDSALQNHINSLSHLTKVEASVNAGVLTLKRTEDGGLLNVTTTVHGLVNTKIETQDQGKQLKINGVQVPDGNFNDTTELAEALDALPEFRAEALNTGAVRVDFSEITPVYIESKNLIFSVEGSYPVPVPRDDYYPAYETLVGAIQGGQLDEKSFFELNGVKISGFEVQAKDASGTLCQAINAEYKKTGIKAHLDATSRLVLTAQDGRNIEVRVAGRASSITGLQQAVQGGELTLRSNNPMEIYFGLAGETDMNDALGDLGGSVGQKIFGVTQEYALSELSLMSTAEAKITLRSVDLAIDQMNQRLGAVGAYESQLSSRVSALEEEQVTLSASRAAITDADFALESATLARQQVLQQASSSLLAQANSASEVALQLLQSSLF